MNTIKNSPARPDAAWSTEELAKYALARAEEIGGFGRKTILHTWLFGEAFYYMREVKKRDKTWVKWVKTQPYSLTSATQAIELYQTVPFQDLDACMGLNISQLKAALGIIKEVPSKKRKQANTETATGADRQPNHEAPDHKLAKTTPLGIFDGGSQGDEQPAIVTPEQAPEVSAAPKQDAAEARTETPAQKITLVTAMEYMHRINMKLAEVERDLEGVEPDEHLIAQIDIAISTLKRLRGEETTETDAA